MRRLLLTLFFVGLCLFGKAQGPAAPGQSELDSLEARLKYQTGTVKLENGVATLRIPEGFGFLDAKQSRFVLETLWGNPEDESVLGLIVPSSVGVLGEKSWAFVVQYEKIGYVKDTDADEINYEELLIQMKEDAESENEEREKAGYAPIRIVGWAAPPFYDKERKILHWAKNIKFGESQENTLNYNVRILGRSGVLVLNAVSSMGQLPEVNKNISKVLNIATFDKGFQYADFNPEIDEVAGWTLGGLVAGKVLAKAGFFVALLKFWKVIVVAIGGLFSFLWKRLTGRKAEETAVVDEMTSEQE